jgi:hypothetical protein
LSTILTRVHELAADGKIRLTDKAVEELSSLELELDADDIRDVLVALNAADSAGRLRSTITDEWLYVWKPRVFETALYVKLVVRGDCVVVSFHEDGGGHEKEHQA